MTRHSNRPAMRSTRLAVALAAALSAVGVCAADWPVNDEGGLALHGVNISGAGFAPHITPGHHRPWAGDVGLSGYLAVWLDGWLADRDFVTREEFEALKLSVEELRNKGKPLAKRKKNPKS